MYCGPFLVILFMGAMGVDERARQTADSLCGSYGYSLMEGKFGSEEHLLCIRMEPIGMTHLATKSTALLLDPDPEYSEVREELAVEELTLAYGFPVHSPAAGSAEGYVGEDHQFYGVLHLGNRTLHADPYGTDDPGKTFGAFENDNMLAPLRPRRDHAQFDGAFSKVSFPFHIEQRRRSAGTAHARICDLLLLADKEFFERDANSSLNHVVRRMIHAVAQADIIFRNSDFNEDGVPDNIGFSVKYILVLTSDETNSRVFGDLVGQRAVDGRSYLMRFARLRRLSEVCLGVAFSGHAFHNRTLGLSFTSLGGGLGGAAGGLCDRRAYGRSFNTLALAHAAAEARVPERIAALTLAHEMGHSFGAHHDDNFPNPECRGYLMGSQSSPANSPMHFEFSMCSKRLIAATLSSMSYCLSEQDVPYCGNGIVEEGEACDCGLPSRCADLDPCCTPRAGGALLFDEGTLHKAGCEVAPSAMCHPSQGPCCDRNCKYANLSKDGIECKHMGLECTCDRPECRCGLGGRCLPDRSCHAAECVALGLQECQCSQKSIGGRLKEARRCGACCLLPADRCLAAETAASHLAVNMTIADTWIDDDYKGPNLTIRVCDDCGNVTVRAWPAGDYCVTQNAIGVCSPRGVCKLGLPTPRSNVYPNVMLSTFTTQHLRSSSERAKLSALLIYVTICMLK